MILLLLDNFRRIKNGKSKNIEDVIAEQAVRKAATCYSRGVDRSI